MMKLRTKKSNNQHTQDKKRHGFSVVEVAIVVAVIGILAGIVGVISVGVQRDARNNTRKASATALAESLEKYHQENGEYPSVSSIASPAGLPVDTVKTKLSIPSGDILVFPQSTDKTIASITTGNASADQIKYEGTCTLPAAACSSFTLTYREEGTNNPVTFKSRAIVGGDQVDDGSLPKASRPSVSGTLGDDSRTITVTASGATCTTGEPKYKIRYATSTATLASTSWPAEWSRGPATLQFTGVGAAPSGTTYYFDSIAKCFLGSASGAESQDSLDGSVLVPPPPIPTPGNPIVSGSTSGATTTWSWSSAVSCSPYTKYYRIRVINSATQSVAWSEGYTTTSYAATTNTEGVWYQMEVQAYCQNGANRAYSAVGTNRYTRPIASYTEATSGQLIVVKNGGSAMAIQLQVTGYSRHCASGLTPLLQYQISANVYPNIGSGDGSEETFGGYSGWMYFYPPGGALVLNVMNAGAGGANGVKKHEVATNMMCWRSDSGVEGPKSRADRYGNAWVLTARNTANNKPGSWQRGCAGHVLYGRWNPSTGKPTLTDELGRGRIFDAGGWCTAWGPGAPI